MASGAAIAGVDHCIVGVHDLEAARARYAALGFTVTPRGRHIGWATANYCVMFPDDYIELLGILDPGGYCAGLDRTLAEQGEGLLKLALRSEDADRTHDFLAGHGLAPEPVKDLARALEAPEGTVMPAFRLLHPRAGATPGLSAFVCQHLTPALVWRQEWSVHRNTAAGVSSYAILADDPAALADGWARVFGVDAVNPGRGRLTVSTGTARLDFMTADSLADAFKGAQFAEPVAGRILAMTICVGDLDTAGACLAEAGVACIRTDGGLVVPPEDACGAAIKFVERV